VEERERETVRGSEGESGGMIWDGMGWVSVKWVFEILPSVDVGPSSPSFNLFYLF